MVYTDFDGKPNSFVPGREVPNKEPAASKFVVEKLYKVHRERIRDMQPIVDCKMEIPAFMQGNQSWKKITEEHRKEIVKMENEVIYQRIAKMENSESAMTKSARLHKRRVENELKLMKSLKLKGRIRDFLKLQRENEDMLRRIERARPQYSLKGCKEWYKHHELFKKGRRSDHTGGHLGFTTLKGLMPKKIGVPEDEISNLELAMNASVMMDSVNDSATRPRTTLDSRGNLPGGRKTRGKHLASTGSYIHENANRYAQNVLNRRSERAKTASSTFSAIQAQNSMFDLDEIKAMGGVPGNVGSDGTNSRPDRTAPTHQPPRSADKIKRSLPGKLPTSPISTPQKGGSARKNAREKRVTLGDSSKSRSGAKGGGGGGGESDDPLKQSVGTDECKGGEGEGGLEGIMSPGMRASSDSLDDGINDGVTILLQRPITIPFQSVGCTVQIVVRLGGTSAHEFVVRAVSNSSPRVLYSERVVPIDDVFSLLNDESSSSSMIQAATDSGDLISLRALLISMFKEVDDDGNGYLTYDEFEMLMEKVELGIQPRELRYVIQEADENENGVVEFDEFVPLAVDMIQSFRALNRAKIVCSQRDSMFEEEVRAKMNTYDFEHLSGICMEKLHEHDPKQYGVMRITEFKRCLSQVAYAADLSESSIAMIVHKLPSDSFGRLLYNGLIDVMEKVKFIELKNKLVHENASSMQEDLFLACRKAEMSQVALEGDGTGAVGILSESIVANILANCGENLSRLQICVLLVAGKNSYGDVDYIQFVPIAAKAIEYMFEPKALRQRAELIEKTDLGSEELLHAATTDVDLFVEKFRGLFDSCDVDHSGMMGVEEFFLCIKALEMELTDAEIEAYWSSIHQDAHPTDDGVLAGEISFQAAVDFLRENIRGMERKKQNRQLAKTLHTTNNFLNMAEEQIKEKEEELTSKLTKLFALSDEANTGFFTTTEMHHILSSLDLGMTEVELGMIVSEADRMDGDEDGLIEHALFLPKCVELLLTFVAKMATDLKENENAKYALELAEKIISSNTDEIMQIASYIRTRLVVIDEGVKNTESRFSALHDMLRDFHSGLTKSEATAIYDHFLNEARGKGSEMGVETLLAMTSGKVQREERVRSHALQLEDGSAPQASPGEDMEGPISPNTNQASKKRIGGYLTKDQMRRNKKKTLAATVATLQANHKVTLKKDLSEIIELVTSVRRVSIQTNIMKQMNPVSCTKLVLNRLLELREDMIEAGEVEKMSIYLPVKACYEALKSLSELRLSQPQILSIISWAECYDKTGMNLDYQRFAEHAAKVMTQLFDTETLLARSHILDNTKDIEKESMQGMSKEDINEYLRQALGGEDSVSLEKYVEMLQMMPVVKLSRAEAIAAASAHHEMFFEGKLAGETVIELTFDILQHICRERFVQRRIALHIHDGKATTKQIDTLKKVAEKFIDFVNVRPVHQNSAAGGAGGVSAKPASGYTADTAKMRGNLLEITLTNEKRGPEIKKRVDANIVESVAPGYGGASNEDDSDMNGSEIFLLESPVTLKVQPRFAKSEKSSLLLGKEGPTVPRRTLRKSPLKKGESLLIANVHSSIPDTVSGTIKVLAVEQEQTMDRHLNLTVDISRGEYSAVASLDAPIKLPMLCATEKSLAVEFVKGLIPRLRVCMTAEKDPTPLVTLGTSEDAESLGNDMGTLFDSMEAEFKG